MDTPVIREGNAVGEMKERGGLNGGDGASWSGVDTPGCRRQRGGWSCTSSPSILSSQAASTDLESASTSTAASARLMSLMAPGHHVELLGVRACAEASRLLADAAELQYDSDMFLICFLGDSRSLWQFISPTFF
jgi:hypothetical protein